METKEIIIDAKNKSLGRTAVEAALCLRGKNKASYLPNVAPETKVKVINVDKAKFTGKKLEMKYYKRYSGYPGNLKIISFQKMLEKDPKAVFKKIVSGMIPKNRLTKKILKNLIIEL